MNLCSVASLDDSVIAPFASEQPQLGTADAEIKPPPLSHLWELRDIMGSLFLSLGVGQGLVREPAWPGG